MAQILRVLIVEDSQDDFDVLLREIRRAGFDVAAEKVATLAGISEALRRQKWDIVLSDYALAAFTALNVLKIVQEEARDLPVVIISGSVNERTVVEAIRAGAFDYMMTDNLLRLGPAIERALRESALRKERKLLEEQFLQSQKMEAIGRLAGGIAHDFNNLLTIISGYTQLLLTRTTVEDSSRSSLEEIERAAGRAADLTRQLLAFSRRQALQPRVVDLNELVANMEKMLRRMIGEDVEVVTVPSSNLKPVKADPGQIEQVIMNLALNSRDAMPHGGKLIIETANVMLDGNYVREHVGTKPGPYAMLAITDTGVGMNAETRSHMFEPFFTTKEAGRGTGLGLATVYGIVKQSGGSTWVYSEVGIGTTVKVYLPAVSDAVETPQQEALTAGRGKGTETVLLVEDEKPVRDLVSTVLRGAGYRVLEANNGEDALKICNSNREPPQLLLTDVVLPEMSGPELAAKVLAVRPEVKTLYVSGYTDEAMSRYGILGSAKAFLQKPFMPSALLQKVRDVLDAPAQAVTPSS